MKCIKTILFLSMIAVASVVSADYLYWMTQSHNGEYKLGDYASLYAVDAVDSETATFVDGAGYLPKYGYIVGASDVSDYSSSLFYITITHDGNIVYNGLDRNNLLSYATLENLGYIRPAASESDTSKFWDAAAIPEPTGGMLLLLGAALLGLRRKKSPADSAESAD